MAPHRVSLSDRELNLVVSALLARAAGVGHVRGQEIIRLAARLTEMTPGNPNWILDGGNSARRPAKRSTRKVPRLTGIEAAEQLAAESLADDYYAKPPRAHEARSTRSSSAG